MKLTDELNEKFPFLYCIRGEYYAFGMGICGKCENSLRVQEAYNMYMTGRNMELTEQQAVATFKHVSCVAKETCARVHSKEEFEENFSKMNFSEEDLNEIEKQVDWYVAFWTKHELNHFFNSMNLI